MGQQALAPAGVWKSRRVEQEFRLLFIGENVQNSHRLSGTQRCDHVPNTSQWGQHRSGARVQNFAKSPKASSLESVQHTRKSSRCAAGYRSLFFSHLEANWKHLHDAHIHNHGNIFRALTKLFPPVLLSPLASPCSHALDCVTPVCLLVMGRSKIQVLAAQPRTAWGLAELCVFGSPCRKRTLFLVWNVDNRDSRGLARRCVGTGGRCSVRTKTCLPNACISRSETHSSRDHTHPTRLSLEHAMILTMDARRLQRTHPLCGMGSSLNTSKNVGMGVTDFALTCGSEPVVDAVCTAAVGSTRTGRVLDAGSDREDRSSDVCYVGDTR